MDWQLSATEEYLRRQKLFAKKHLRELTAVLDNLDTYHRALNAGVNPLQIKFGFVHSEGRGLIAIDQTGGGKSLMPTRLYVFPDLSTQTLYLVTLGDKRSQPRDIQSAYQFLQTL